MEDRLERGVVGDEARAGKAQPFAAEARTHPALEAGVGEFAPDRFGGTLGRKAEIEIERPPRTRVDADMTEHDEHFAGFMHGSASRRAQPAQLIACNLAV